MRKHLDFTLGMEPMLLLENTAYIVGVVYRKKSSSYLSNRMLALSLIDLKRNQRRSSSKYKFLKI
jgi:hypothetical protein